MIIFVASYASGMGNAAWQGELFGLEGVYTVTFLYVVHLSDTPRGFILYVF